MSICRLVDGCFEASIQFDAQEPKRFKYATRAEAQELVDSERVFWLLRSCGVKAPCANRQIHAAADALLRAPCAQDIVLLRWTHSKSRWIRSWSRDVTTYAVYAKRREELPGRQGSTRRRENRAETRHEVGAPLTLGPSEELLLLDDKPFSGFKVEQPPQTAVSVIRADESPQTRQQAAILIALHKLDGGRSPQGAASVGDGIGSCDSSVRR